MEKLKVKKVAFKDFKGDKWVLEAKDLTYTSANAPSSFKVLNNKVGDIYVVWRPTNDSEQVDIVSRTSIYSLMLMIAGGTKLSDIIMITEKVYDALGIGDEVWGQRSVWAKGHNLVLK